MPPDVLAPTHRPVLCSQAISELLDKCLCRPRFNITRESEGKYSLEGSSKTLLMRVLRTVGSPAVPYHILLPPSSTTQPLSSVFVLLVLWALCARGVAARGGIDLD